MKPGGFSLVNPSAEKIEMPHESAIINIRIYNRGERLYGSTPTEPSQASRQERFWTLAVPALESKEWSELSSTIRKYESKIESELGYKLKELFVKAYPSLKKRYYPETKEKPHISPRYQESLLSNISSWYERIKTRFLDWLLKEESPHTSPLSDETELIQELSFKTRILGYSSLDAELSITPWGLVSEFLDFDLIRIALDEFLPPAFVATIQEADPNRLEFDVDIPDSTENKFYETVDGENKRGIRRMHSKTNSQASKPEYVRKLVQATFLFPTLLALAVLYIAFNRLMDWGTKQNDAYKEIISAQKQIIEEDRTRFLLLFDRLMPPKQENTAANSSAEPLPEPAKARTRTPKPRRRGVRTRKKR